MSERCYREIFVNDFNISSFHPKKNQWSICVRWNNLNGKEKHDRAQEKMKHDHNKKYAVHCKAKVKAECMNDASRRMATFDHETILQVPCSQVSRLYYTHKLIVYNFTVYGSHPDWRTVDRN